MKGALIILAVTVVAGIVLYILHRLGERRGNTGDSSPEPAADEAASDPEGCCGQHIVCEKDSLLQGFNTDIVYYDDQELDDYRDVPADGYTEEQIEQFRDVLYTMRDTEVAGWVRSLQLRGVALPDALKDEVILIVGERRSAGIRT